MVECVFNQVAYLHVLLKSGCNVLRSVILAVPRTLTIVGYSIGSLIVRIYRQEGCVFGSVSLSVC